MDRSNFQNNNLLAMNLQIQHSFPCGEMTYWQLQIVRYTIFSFSLILTIKMGATASVQNTSTNHSSSSSHGLIGIKDIYLMLRNENELKESFLSFLTKEYLNTSSFLLTPFDITITSQQQLKEKTNTIINNSYQIPSQFNTEITPNTLELTLQNQQLESLSLTNINFMKEIYNNRKQIVTLLTINSFSLFLKSDDYQRWFWTRENPLTLIETPFKSIFSDIKSNDFDSIISKDSWIQTICHCLDSLPISISIADATQRRFPLIYVNQKFQDQSGYSLQEVIGKSNKFLQRNMVEEPMAKFMTQQLADGKECRVVITNKTKDDRNFRNFLSMKPVHSLDGTYRFIFGIQFDVTCETSSYIAFCIANDLFNILPSICPNEVFGSVKNALSPDF